MRRPYHLVLSVQEDAFISLWCIRVGDHIHVGQQLLQGTYDSSWQVSHITRHVLQNIS